MALKKSELYSSLWAGCDELRDGKKAKDETAEMEAKVSRCLDKMGLKS